MITDAQLLEWVDEQRLARKNGRLSKAVIAKLTAAGFDWEKDTPVEAEIRKELDQRKMNRPA